MTNTALPRAVRAVGEVLEGAAKPVGSDADGVIQLTDQRQSDTTAVNIAPTVADWLLRVPIAMVAFVVPPRNATEGVSRPQRRPFSPLPPEPRP
jgi:hypothetical protein